MAPRMSRFPRWAAEILIRQPIALLCHRLATPNDLDPELRLRAGGSDEGARLPGELQAEFDLDAFRSVRKVAKRARHGNRRRFDCLERRFESIAGRLDHVRRMKP